MFMSASLSDYDLHRMSTLPAFKFKQDSFGYGFSYLKHKYYNFRELGLTFR